MGVFKNQGTPICTQNNKAVITRTPTTRTPNLQKQLYWDLRFTALSRDKGTFPRAHMPVSKNLGSFSGCPYNEWASLNLLVSRLRPLLFWKRPKGITLGSMQFNALWLGTQKTTSAKGFHFLVSRPNTKGILGCSGDSVSRLSNFAL